MINSYRDIRSIAIINVNETIKDNIQRFRKAYRYIADLSLYAKEEGLLFLDSHMDFIEDEDPMTENLIWMVDMIVDSLEPDFLEVIVNRCTHILRICNGNNIYTARGKSSCNRGVF